MPSGQPPGLHPSMREHWYDERMAHKRRGTDDKDALDAKKDSNQQL